MLRQSHFTVIIFSAVLALVTLTAKADEAKGLNNPQQKIILPKPLISPFTATYDLFHKSDKVGTGVRSLSYDKDGLIQYSYTTDIEWLIFSDKRKESTTVSIEKNIVKPVNYQYERSGTGRDKSYKWQYDTNKNTATNLKKNKTITVDFSQHIQNPLSYHLQQRLDFIQSPGKTLFNHSVLKKKGDIKSYIYQFDGEEELMLPYGLVKTIRLKRESSNKSRITYAWFAPELNYALVKLYQTKSGVEQYEALLTHLEIK